MDRNRIKQKCPIHGSVESGCFDIYYTTTEGGIISHFAGEDSLGLSPP